MTDEYAALKEILIADFDDDEPDTLGAEAHEAITTLQSENARLRNALLQCRRAVAGGADEPRRTVREIVDRAIEERDRQALGDTDGTS